MISEYSGRSAARNAIMRARKSENAAESDGFAGSAQNVFDVTTHTQLAAPTITSTRTTDSIKLDWGVVPNASSYKLYRNDVEVYSGSARTYNSTGLEQGTEYTFKLEAIGAQPSAKESVALPASTASGLWKPL